MLSRIEILAGIVVVGRGLPSNRTIRRICSEFVRCPMNVIFRYLLLGLSSFGDTRLEISLLLGRAAILLLVERRKRIERNRGIYKCVGDKLEIKLNS